MVDLANSGDPSPRVTDLDEEAHLLSLNAFREQQNQDRLISRQLKEPSDMDVASALEAMVQSLPEQQRPAMKLMHEPAVRRMLSKRQSVQYLKKFRDRWEQDLYVYEDDDELLDLRDDLRQVFESGDPTNFLSRWGRARARKRSDPGRLRIVLVQLYGKRFPLPEIDLRLVISMAVLGALPQMRRCANPDCHSPYFLADRKTQQYCDRPACAAYGQRQHKLNWWRMHGQARRAAMKAAQNQPQEKKRSAVRTSRRGKRQ